MNSLLQDVRWSARSLRKNPGFTAIVVITLALGVGANTAVFSVVNGIMLRPLPYPDPERFTHVVWRDLDGDLRWATPLQFEHLREHSRVFEAVATYRQFNGGLGEAGAVTDVQGLRVSEGFFKVLGFSLGRGRSFTADEARPGGPDVAVIAHDLWRNRFNADPGILGRTIRIDAHLYTVVGITPADFRFPESPVSTDIFVPLRLEVDPRSGSHAYPVIARIEAGVSDAQLESDLARVTAGLRAGHPDHASAAIQPLDFNDFAVSRDLQRALWTLLGAVVFVLLIGCANVANLALVRAAGRRREIAMRAALGAGRGRIVRQLLTESTLLGLVGGAIGLVLGLWGVDALLALSPRSIPRADAIGLDLRVLGFVAGISVLTGIAFGLGGSLPASRAGLAEVLRDDSRGGGPGRRRSRSIMVAAEAALSLMLLAGAGLMIASFFQLRGIDPGFETDDVLTVKFPRLSPYDSPAEVRRFQQAVIERIGTLPGVAAASAASNLPLGDGIDFPVTVVGRAGAYEPAVEWRGVSEDYLRTLEIPLVRGRFFTAEDAGGPPVAVVNESFARHYFGEDSPIGQRLTLGQVGEQRVPEFHDPARRIIGVVGDIREMALDRPPKRTVYTLYAQTAAGLVMLTVPEMLIRHGAGANIAPAVRRIIAEVEPAMPVPQLRALGDFVGGTLDGERFNALLMSIFAALALVLTAVGIYGVVAYAVRERTREVGLRMALGAQTGRVARMVLRESLVVVGIGAAVGLAGSIAVTRVLESLLFGVDPADPLTLSAVTALLLGIAALASLLPARRAARVDPMRALRSE